MSDEALRELNNEITQWEQMRDDKAIKALDRFLSRDLLFRRANRTVVNKETFMKDLRDRSPFASRESRNATVTILQDRAMVLSTVIATKHDGTRGAYRNIRVFFLRDGAWHLEVWFNDDVTSLAEL